MHDQELEQAIAEFLGAFEVVFHEDWPYSKEHLRYNIDRIIPPDDTFIRSSLDPERVNWGARAALLQSYERLRSVMTRRGVEPEVPIRDAYFVYTWRKKQR